MAIGYANFGAIQQGNQQVVNSMAGLGQQISGAIETHAATQSAQAMLPMLQQQYSSGMQKIADGDPNGLGDIYGAALTASQNPLLAPMAANAISTAQSANINAQHMARTQAFLQGKNISSMAAHPEAYNPDGTLNTSRLGQAAPAKPFTPYQQEQMEKSAAKDKTAQVDQYSQLYSGDTKSGEIGISGYADKINKAVKEGTDVSPEDLQGFAKRYSYYKQKQSAYGKNALNNEDIDKAYDDIKDHLTIAQSDLDKKIQEVKKKGEDPSSVSTPREWLGPFGNIWPTKKDLSSVKTNLDETLKNLENIHNIGKQGNVGGMPSARGGGQQGNSTQTLIQAVQAAQKHPDKVDLIKSRLKDAGIDPALFDQAIKSQQTQQQSSSQTSNMIPAASQVASAEEPQTATPEEVA